MSKDPKIRFLRDVGYAEMQHDSHVPFLAHLIGTQRLLRTWGAREALCDAGLFHSAYGTEYFAPEAAPTRAAVEAMIGADAEEIVWLWCEIRRASLDPAKGTVLLRHEDAPTRLPLVRIQDIASLWAADTVEQIDRMSPDEQEFSHGVQRLSEQMLPAAREALEEANLR